MSSGTDIVCYLIDDDTEDQEIFIMALQDINIPVYCHTADNGIDALNKLNSDPTFIPDYIFLDLNMPRMGGRECLEELKKIPRLANSDVIIYSTSSEFKDLKETKELGADHFLTKPYSLTTLSDRLKNFFQKKEKQLPVDYQI